MNNSFRFSCPLCHSSLVRIDADIFLCPVHQVAYPYKTGIWRFLPPALDQEYQQFIQEYQSVRRAEGRGALETAYYRSLPYKDLSGRYVNDWKIRARSFQSLLHSVVAPTEKKTSRALKVLDLGAGNGWLSYRMAGRFHQVAAIDLQTNSLDGLGAHIYYDVNFMPIQADFNHLPFSGEQADLIIFNASFHYSTDYITSITEALRVLRPEGQIVILDSPIYRDTRSGEEMVREREEQYRREYGFASNAIPSENYLTFKRLDELEQKCGVHWRLVGPFYGAAWAIRPIRARLAGRREPAQFHIAVGHR